WSSDVCSSDLGHAEWPALGYLHQLVDLVRRRIDARPRQEDCRTFLGVEHEISCGELDETPRGSDLGHPQVQLAPTGDCDAQHWNLRSDQLPEEAHGIIRAGEVFRIVDRERDRLDEQA